LAVLTTTQRLEAVQTAITAVLAGQSFTIDGVTFTRANLSTLYKQEAYLENKLSKEGGNRPFMKSIGFGGMSY
jgi:Flp pilus assembly protein protease CpaA